MVKDGVVSRISIGLLKTILKSVKITADTLGGTKHPQNFVLGMVLITLITLYKDMTAMPYGDLQMEVAGWAHLLNEVIQHHVKKCCLALQKWEKELPVDPNCLL